jgi:serine/threonine protein kinase
MTTVCPSCGKPLARDAPKGLCQECLLKAGFPTGVDTGGNAPRFVPPPVAELAALFPQLEILNFIGQGGMGAVYKARQTQIDRVVALKILPETAGGPGFAERFAREVRALAKLNHPNIVTLYETGRCEGFLYFLMEFVDGVSLRQLVNAGPIAPGEALAIVPRICEALQYAHERGIVHRDIKPENILLGREGRVKIADFGVAKIMAQGRDDIGPENAAAPPSAGLTQAGGAIGTPQYMAPEQVRDSADVDHRADIYSLGVVFYQMLTGELPSGGIEPPSKKAAIDARLDEVVLRALKQKPEMRYQQVSQVKERVETIAASQPPARPPREITPARSAVHRSAIDFAVVALVIVGFFGTEWFIASRNHASQPPTPAAGAGAATPSGSSEPVDIIAAREKLTSLRLTHGEQDTVVLKALARLNELERLTRDDPAVPPDLREALAHLAELRVDYFDRDIVVLKQLALANELQRLTRDEPGDPPDLRAAKAHLAEVRVDHADQDDHVRQSLAQIAELERLSRDEPGDPPDLREAKAHLAALRAGGPVQNHGLERAQARVNELERMTKDEPEAPRALREARARLMELRVDHGEQSPPVQAALAQVRALQGGGVASFGPPAIPARPAAPAKTNQTVDEN